MNTIIRLNMTEKKITVEDVPAAYAYLGGRGLTAKIIAAEVPPTCNPLGKFNKIVFAPGLLTGTSAPSSGRLSVGGKSPLTGGIKESNAGGITPQKMANLDVKALIIEGAPEGEDFYILYLGVNKRELIPAGELTGLGTYQLNDLLTARYGKVGVICIGPAGEMMMAGAGISTNDMEGHPGRYAGRGGLGAVLGSKRIKAIVVDSKKTFDAPVKDFDAPGGGLVRDTVCSVSGDQPGPNCPKDALVTEWFAKGKLPSKVCDIHVLVEVCAESNQLPNEYCPTKISRAFVKNTKDSKNAIPTQTCTLHGPGTAQPAGTPVCTDPAHGGVLYLANIPGSGQSGGCPEQYVSYQDFTNGVAPTQACPVAEHQVTTKEPAAPVEPDRPRINLPTVEPR